MNAKTLEAVTKHGNALLAAFPNATEKDPVALCKKLRRIETAVSRWTLQACNGPELPEGKLDEECKKAVQRVAELLGLRRVEIGLKPSDPLFGFSMFINRDPRGYALNLSSEWTRQYNDSVRRLPKCCKCGNDILCESHRQFNGQALKAWKARNLPITTDWGGYGLLAPKLN